MSTLDPACAAIFTGGRVARSLGKWNAAFAAVMLRLWPEIKKQSIQLDLSSWPQITGLQSVPPELQPLTPTTSSRMSSSSSRDRDAKLLGYTATYARHMHALGLKAYMDVGRRLQALALALLPHQFAAARRVVAAAAYHDVGSNFVHTARLCASARHVEDDAVGVVIAYLMLIMQEQEQERERKEGSDGDNKREHEKHEMGSTKSWSAATSSSSSKPVTLIHAAVGAPLPPPLSWTVHADRKITSWNTSCLPTSLSDVVAAAGADDDVVSTTSASVTASATSYPQTYWALLGNARTRQWAIARFDCVHGVREWEVKVDPESDSHSNSWLWIVNTMPFRSTPVLLLIGTSRAALVTPEQDGTCAVVQRTLRLGRTHQPCNDTRTLGRSGQFVLWQRQQQQQQQQQHIDAATEEDGDGDGDIDGDACPVVALDIHKLQVVSDRETLDLIEHDMLATSDAIAAHENFIYTNEHVIGALPKGEQIVAVMLSQSRSLISCVDAFTHAGDWWRLCAVRRRRRRRCEHDGDGNGDDSNNGSSSSSSNSSSTRWRWQAHVVGLNLSPDWHVLDVCE